MIMLSSNTVNRGDGAVGQSVRLTYEKLGVRIPTATDINR